MLLEPRNAVNEIKELILLCEVLAQLAGKWPSSHTYPPAKGSLSHEVHH